MTKSKLVFTFATGALLFAASGCANPQFKTIGSSLLASTGVVDSTQAEGIFSAGDKLAKSQEDFTAEQEYYLGRAVSAKILGQYQPISNAALASYVQKVGMSLVAVSDAPETFSGYRFVIVDSPQINAMSAPAGFVYVSSGFLKKLPDEDSLAAVFAHEIGHVVKRHGVNAISNASLFSALGEAASTGVSVAASRTSAPVDITPLTGMFADSVNGIVDKLLTKGFDRSQEYEADLYAAQLMEKAGYDPHALVRVLEILEKETKDDGEGWFQTHPDPGDRVEEIKDDYTFPANLDVAAARTARFVDATKSVK